MFMDDVVKQGLTLNNHCGPTYKINDMFSLLTDVHLIACVDLTVTLITRVGRKMYHVVLCSFRAYKNKVRLDCNKKTPNHNTIALE